MPNFKKIIKKGLKDGYRFIPVAKNKTPSINSWKEKHTIDDIDDPNKVFKEIDGIALCTGFDHVEALDIDIKYWLRDDIYKELVDRTEEYSLELMNKLVIQRTKNLGFHWIYKAKDLKDGNKKLASRPVTTEEKEKHPHQKVKVLLETRGVGGYIVIAPSEGYKFVQGDLKEIKYITKDERDFLWDLFRSYNEVLEEDYQIDRSPVKKQISQMEITPFDDYDTRTSTDDCLGLLRSHGWTIGKTFGSKIKLKRPGDSDSPYSGYYELDRKRFSVFSTSTQFQPETRYKHSAVYTILECNGDYSFAAKQLYADGYGNLGQAINLKGEYKRKELKAPSTPSDFKKFIAALDKGWKKIEDFIDGKIEKGKMTGVTFFDMYWVWKLLAFYSFTAHKGRGKTIIVQALQVISIIVDDWVWIISAKENSIDDYKENLFRYFTHCDVKDLRNNSPKEYEFWKAYIDAHFIFLEGIQTVEEVLLTAEYLVNQNKETTYAVFMDPINSHLTGYGTKKAITFDTGVDIAIKVLDFSMNVCTTFITQHTIISRQRLGMEGVNSAMAEGGYFVNKASYTATLNREQGTNLNIINVDNVRDRKTGGNETKKDNPLVIEWNTYDIDVYMQDGSARQNNFIQHLQDVKAGKAKSFKEEQELKDIQEFASNWNVMPEQAFDNTEQSKMIDPEEIEELYKN